MMTSKNNHNYNNNNNNNNNNRNNNNNGNNKNNKENNKIKLTNTIAESTCESHNIKKSSTSSPNNLKSKYRSFTWL